MKNSITQFSLVIIAFVALSLLMSYSRPAADEPKQFFLVTQNNGDLPGSKDKFEAQVNQKIAEGWHLQGGSSSIGHALIQGMVK